ncbi:MAG: hypothetical protein CMH63_01455 [Nanoarchaeota archaeon]|jgi:hypothetical protein|nr:hypothetical protein [Nanoarchaeota archaeon]|tara:strand:- start:71057 stop:71278 length:222 start_codon:yes stop_codon:yes gene_type:complete
MNKMAKKGSDGREILTLLEKAITNLEKTIKAGVPDQILVDIVKKLTKKQNLPETMVRKIKEIETELGIKILKP